MKSFRIVNDNHQQEFNRLAIHPLQSWSWGEFREKLGQKVIRLGRFKDDKLAAGMQIMIHQIPHTSWTIGYCPRGVMLDKEWISAIKTEAKKYNCIFVKLEPNVVTSSSRATGGSVAISEIATSPRPKVGTPRNDILVKLGLRPGKNLFTPYTFQLDLTKSEDELMAGMKSKTRYNVRLAEKKGVVIEEDNSAEAFAEFQRLTEETTRRQKFFAHDRRYRQLMWQTMKDAGIAHLIVAKHHPSSIIHHSSILTAWVIFIFNGVSYYPYGASSNENRELMASNLLAWKALLLAKKLGCKMFDFWGSLGPNPDPKDPWYGFHSFKEGYGGKLVEFVGTWDLVLNPAVYIIYNLIDKLRWQLLRLFK